MGYGITEVVEQRPSLMSFAKVVDNIVSPVFSHRPLLFVWSHSWNSDEPERRQFLTISFSQNCLFQTEWGLRAGQGQDEAMWLYLLLNLHNPGFLSHTLKLY